MSIFGGLGNKWWKDNLLRQGFRLVTTIAANTGEEAVAIYIKSLKSHLDQPANQTPSLDGKEISIHKIIDDSKKEVLSKDLDVLERLARLKEKGILTEEEFVAQKDKLLGNK